MDEGDAAASRRLDRLFATFDRLTPDELAHIGFRPAPDDQREPLLAALDRAARETGRVALVAEAREAAREAILRRYAAGSLHPTFIALNWGLSQGPVEDRVAIAEALADAAAAAVVRDALPPDVAAALAFDADAITELATGTVSEGSFARVLGDAEAASRPALGIAKPATVAVGGAAAGFALMGVVGAGIGALVAAALLAGLRQGRRGPHEGRRDGPGGAAA